MRCLPKIRQHGWPKVVMTIADEKNLSGISHLIADIASRLANSDSPRLDARWLIGLALRRDEAVFSHEELALTPSEQQRLQALVSARQQGRPISRMRGKRGFYRHEFYLNDATLDPRADSEILVQTAISYALSASAGGGEPYHILDLGTGTGCLVLSVLDEVAGAQGMGIDCQPLAVAQARANAAHLSLSHRAEFRVGDWCEGLEKSFDMILVNPPYIADNCDELKPDVKDFDPPAALFAGAEGYDAYHRLIPQLPYVMNRNAICCVEIGVGQQDRIIAIAEQAHLRFIEHKRDLGGRIRTLIFQK